MDYKRITILCGHYGSGKTNVAINIAEDIKRSNDKVIIADMDIVNPYFRTKDSEEELESKGIKLICSPFAESNVDLPSLPQEIYAITDDQSQMAVVDVGGDERGALALGRLANAIREENNYDMYMVINCYRPLTSDAASTFEVMQEIENACGLKFTGIINNSNLAEMTTAATVLDSYEYAAEFARMSGLKIAATTVNEKLYDELKNEPGIMKIHLQKKPFE